MNEMVNPPGPGGVIHLAARGGYTMCRIFIPDLPAADRWWTPHPQDVAAGRQVIGPTSCPHCIAGTPAPMCSTDPRALTLWTIYARPRDYPGDFVAREWKALHGKEVPGAVVARASTLERCREGLDDYLRRVGRGGLAMLCRMPRFAEDEPQIAETWM